jgi:hypothetical protein
MGENRMPRDIYERIYNGCQNTTLWHTMRAVVEQAAAYTGSSQRRHYQLLCNFKDFDVTVERGLHHELLHDIQQLAVILEEDYAAQFGPQLSLEGPPRCSMTRSHILAFNFDAGETLCRFELPTAEFSDTGLYRAAAAYRRACDWDFTPGEGGIWLCYYLLTSGGGSDKGQWSYTGNIAGFAILQDCDEDGVYESLAHVWTAAAARRRGIARALIAYARKHYPIQEIERPLTSDGSALIKAVWPERLETRQPSPAGTPMRPAAAAAPERPAELERSER